MSRRLFFFLSANTLRISEEAAQTLWTFTQPVWFFLTAAFAANLTAAFFEGSTIGALALALKTLSGPPQISVAALLGRFGQWMAWPSVVLNRESLFLSLVFIAVVTQVLRSALQFLGVAATAQVQVYVQSEAHRRMFTRIMRLSFPQVSRYRLGDLTDYLNQARSLHEICASLNVIVSNMLLVGMYALLLVCVSWPMTVAALSIYWVVSRGLRSVMVTIRYHANRAMASMTVVTSHTTELLQAMRLLHTFARQEHAIGTMNNLMAEWIRNRRRATVWGAIVPLVMDTVTVIGVAVFLIGGYRIYGAGGGATVPRLLTFLLALYRMAPRIGLIHSSFAVLANLSPSVARMTELLNEPEVRSAGQDRERFHGMSERIEFYHVTLQYQPDELPAVMDLSFCVSKGSFTAVIGVSGAGKSSMVDLLLQLYEPTSGSILVDGKNLSSFDVSSWCERLGVVSQDQFLFHASIRDNIAFGNPQATLEEIIAAARAAHAEEFIKRLAQGYDTVVGDRGYRLSGGQRQRIALARALIRQPDILVLDEATSALDSESEHLIQQAMEEQRGQRTVLAIAHRLSTIWHADHILVLEQGRLVEQGTHAELLGRGGIYARLWRLQSEGVPMPQQAPALADTS